MTKPWTVLLISPKRILSSHKRHSYNLLHHNREVIVLHGFGSMALQIRTTSVSRCSVFPASFIPSRNAATSLPFFGNIATLTSFPLEATIPKKRNALIRVQLKDYGFDDRSKDYKPSAEFYKVEAVLRPWRLSPVSSALLKMGIRGVSVTDVRGFGAQGGSRERQAGTEFAGDSFLQKVKLEIVVSKEQVDAVIDTIIDQARTGEIGDGKIFVSPVADIIRIRTGERGLDAERMAGGRAAMQVSVEGSDGN